MPGPHSPSDTRNYLGFGKEASKGTSTAPTQFVAYTDDVDLDHGQEIRGHKEAGGAGSITLSEKLGHNPTGGFAFRARPSIAARLAAYLLGIDTISGVADPFSHELKPDLVTDYLSIEQNLADEGIERFIDSVIASMTWEVDNADTQILRVSGTWIGSTPAFQAAATAESYDAGSPFTLSEGVFIVDGSTVTNVQRMSVTHTARYAVEKVSGVTPLHLVKLAHDVTGEIRQLVDDIDTEYRKVHYGSATGTSVLATPTPGSLTADFSRVGPPARQHKLEILNLDWLTAVYTPLNPDPNEAVKLTRTFAGRVSGGTALLTVFTKNADATAYV